jgi:hypothetical protein
LVRVVGDAAEVRRLALLGGLSGRERESRVREGGGSRAGGSPLWCRTGRCQYRILKWISELGGACRDLSRCGEGPGRPILSPPAGYELRQWRTTPSVHNYAPFGSAHHQSTLYRDGRAHDVPQEARARHALRGHVEESGAQVGGWPAAPRLLRTCSVDVSGMPARLRAVAMLHLRIVGLLAL